MDHLERLLDPGHAFSHPVTVGLTLACGGALLLAPLLIAFASRGMSDERQRELWLRWRTWLVIAPALFVPVLLGALWTILGLTLLAIASQREFSRMTGAFREGRGDAVAALLILLIGLGALDHWYGFFNAMTGLGVALIAAVELLEDRPRGYIRRTALAILGLVFFGTCLLHLGYLANDPDYRPKLLLVIVAVGLQDVLAFVVGRLFGKRKLAPVTSPGKTLEGAVGALLLTTLFVYLLSGVIWTTGTMAEASSRLLLGLAIGLSAQCGDLILSSIKRDVGVKDSGALLPGHGGLLDRFDSLTLAAPVAFHVMNVFGGFAWVGPGRVFTG